VRGVEAATVTKADGEDALAAVLEDRKIDLIVLAGYLTILSPGFVRRFENRIVNVHPSLIPASAARASTALFPTGRPSGAASS
jgi:phosphoribosylglycinamide formyltransferase-1